MQDSRRTPFLGKYREIVLAVACFLVFDMAVLVLNFYISFQISESAVAINLAGRQRMLSQAVTKELLAAEQDIQQGLSPELTELARTSMLFDNTLRGFQQGGEVQGGMGQPVLLNALHHAEARRILSEAGALWQPLLGLLRPLQDARFNEAALHEAAAYARSNNQALLKLMNQLTTQLEADAAKRANTLRLVQTVGILLALLNFAFILFKFLGRLREGDRRIEAAQEEIQEILHTVKEGLFLLGQDFRIGSQFSASLPAMLGREIRAGDDFRLLLQQLVPAAVHKSACEYISLLLGDRVKEALVQDLNPLSRLSIQLPEAAGGGQRHLSLQFSRALQGGQISHLLVTVFDVTAQVELEAELIESRRQAKAEVEVMLDLLKVNPATLKQFLDGAEQRLLDINDRLRHVDASRDCRRSLNAIFTQMHGLKGEAAALGLDMFEALAQQFEGLLAGLRQRGEVSGQDLLGLPLPLDEFLTRINAVRELSRRLADYQSAFTQPDEGTLLSGMQRLAQRIAQDQGKAVQLNAELGLLDDLPAPLQQDLQQLTLQLLRNAVVHGIERPEERRGLAKPPMGQIYVALKKVDDEYELVFRDDGRGLCAQRIRQTLLARGLYTEAQLNELGERQVIMKIFEPGFSTISLAGRDAGHGVGLDVVKAKLLALSARLRIATRVDGFTQFSIRFAA